MKLKVVGTGSKGNCYLLEHKGQVMVLDCGMPFKEITRELNYRIDNVIAILVTHQHLDHSKAINDFRMTGTKIYAPYLNFENSIVFNNNCYVQTFELPHDGTDNYGFLITWDGERILYMTDFEYCKYRFKGINHMILECNYQKKYIDTDAHSFEHKVRGHCSLETCKDFVYTNCSDSLNNVILVHLGAETCVGNEIVNEVKKVARIGSHVAYAYKGLEVQL